MPLALPTDTTAKLTAIKEEDPNAIDSSSHHYSYHALPHRRRHLLPLSAWKGLTFADFDKSPHKTVKRRNSKQGIMLGSHDTSPVLSKGKKKSSDGDSNIKKPKKSSPRSKQSFRADVTKPSSLKQINEGDDEDLAMLPPSYVQKPISTSELTATTQDMTESERSHEDPVAVQAQKVETKPKATRKKTKKKKSTSQKKEKSKKKMKKDKTKKAKKKKKEALGISSVADDSQTVHTIDIERRLQEIDQLERLLMDERLALQSDQDSICADKAIMKYIIKEEVHRTNQMEGTIDALQARVLDMQQQELAMLEKGLQDRTKTQDHMTELQAKIDHQAKEIEQLQAKVKSEVDENKILRVELRSLKESNEKERKEWEKEMASKEDTIAFLMKELEKLKKEGSFRHQSPMRTTSLSGSSVDGTDVGTAQERTTIDAPPSPKESVMHKLQTLMQPPSAPKSAKKEKVSLQGMNMEAFKPPLEDVI